ncbi:MAG: hypothetical protein ABIX46_13570 [Burkholderiaceae bacterium]
MTALPRRVQPETLDGLAPDDPAARRSRADLRRIHRVMGTRSITLRALRGWHWPALGRPLRVLELGAGDASVMLGVARRMAAQWPPVELTLLDRQPVVDIATLEAYAKLGWTARSEVRDVVEWAGAAEPVHHDLIVAHLFLHHFDAAVLRTLLHAIAARCDRAVACEPRRSVAALVASHLVAAIGANAVTREDAVLSVHAGFDDRELTALWPRAGWQVDESRARLFTHCLRAQRLATA